MYRRFFGCLALLVAAAGCSGQKDNGHEQTAVEALSAESTDELRPQNSEEASWASAIASVEKLREGFERRRRGEWVHMGTALNELHVKEHSCSILGRMLGKERQIKHLEIDYSDTALAGFHDNRPEVSDDDLAVAMISLDNWLVNAQRLVAARPDERVREWNLDCVGQFDIPTSAYIQETNADAFFTLNNEGAVLRVLGDVEEGFAARLDAALNRHPTVKVVALGSAGGSVYEAIRAGQNIRGRRLSTVLWNECLSACTLVFLGGVERQIWSPYPRLGFHRVSLNGRASDLNDAVYSDIATYARIMGANPHAVHHAMAQAMPWDMNYPDGEYLCNASIITWMQRAYTDC